MSSRSPAPLSRLECTSYEFTTSLGIDYNYDPACSATPGRKPAFDPYADPPVASPIRDRKSRTNGSEDDCAHPYYPAQNPDTRSKQTPPPSAPPPPPIPTSPSPEYIAESQKPSTRLSTPTAARKLLILDLNGTLVYRTPHARREFHRPYRRRGNPRQVHHHHSHTQHTQSSYQSHTQLSHAPEDAPYYSQPYTDQYQFEFQPQNGVGYPPEPSLHPSTYHFQTPHYTAHPHPQSHPHLHPHREAYPNPNPNPQSQLTIDPADPYAPRGLRNVYSRPYMGAFHDYLFHPSTRAWLDTMVWSSAQPHSVDDMVDKAFGSRKEELVAVWARDTLGLEEKDYFRKTQTTKDLARPWAKLAITPTGTDSDDTPVGHSAHTTLLLDDSPLKAHLQPWNHLCIREYSGALRQVDIQCRAKELRDKQMREWNDQNQNAEEGSSHAHVNANAINAPSSPSSSNQIQKQLSPDDLPQTQLSNDDSIPSSTLTDTDLPKKRKRPKKNKPPPPPFEPEDVLRLGLGGFDPTLLAVIGVLEAVKWEGNVAGWMRSGGLSSASVEVEVGKDEEGGDGGGDDDGDGAEDEEGAELRGDVYVDGGTQRQRAQGLGEGNEGVDSVKSGSGYEKRRRVSNEMEVEASGTITTTTTTGTTSPPTIPHNELTPPNSPPTCASASPPTTTTSTPPTVSPTLAPNSATVPETNAPATNAPATTATVNIGDTGQWFEDHVALRYWVRRGVRALEGLGIEVVSGVVAPG